MTTQDLYTKLSTGDITEQKFLYEVRRDINLPFITPMNNFKDTVTILKNKGIISEKQTKLSTGKQDVEIISKTIDMVNPYEYSKGMDIELGVANEAVGNVDITEEDIKKAQKKVLKNLTKEPNYYSKKNTATMGDSEYDVEVTPKVIEKIKKDAKKNNKKFIREHGEEHDKVSQVMGSISPLEETEKTQAFVLALDMYKNAKGTGDEKKALDNLEKVSQSSLGVKLPLEGISEQQMSMFNDEEITDVSNLKDLPFQDRQKILIGALKKFKEAKGTTGIKGAKEYLVKVTNAMGIPINVDDLLESPKSLGENKIEELGRLRDAIYEKYAKKYGVDVNELKDKLEAKKLETEDVDKATKLAIADEIAQWRKGNLSKEQLKKSLMDLSDGEFQLDSIKGFNNETIEAIEVEDEDTAIAVQKKSPDSDVRIVKK